MSKILDDDHLPARRGDVRELRNEVHNIAKKLLAVDIQLNPPPFAKPTPSPRLRALEEALQGMLDKYVNLVQSGDAGFWNPENEAEVIAARNALTPASDKGGADA